MKCIFFLKRNQVADGLIISAACKILYRIAHVTRVMCESMRGNIWSDMPGYVQSLMIYCIE